ncbi:MAG: hypothetical protein ABJN75_21125 [Hoeflea sp.]|uniref:hypothetical protein n=1 Tax=Hoeflea sp. TaxID=1940281 RepID=UPI003298153F
MRMAILCRGSQSHGLGHLYRAASFAHVANRSHEIAIVAVADEEFLPVFGELETRTTMVSSDSEAAAIVSAGRFDVCVCDCIALSTAAFTAIRTNTPTVASISPVFEHADRTDLFFTRSSDVNGIQGPKIFAGLAYAIINSQCRPIADSQHETALAHPSLSVMLSFGGADSDNHSGLMVELLRDVKMPLLLWIMLGDGYSHSHDTLVSRLSTIRRHEIILARTNRSMWSVAANCAVGILSSGMSTIEAIYAGLPVISVRRSGDPSAGIATEYDALCINGGQFFDGSYMGIKDTIEELSSCRDTLRALRQRQKGLIDNKGAQRVLEAIESHVEPMPEQVDDRV